jgi:hypothetical protein
LPQNPQRQVHALLGVFVLRKTRRLKIDTAVNLTEFYTLLNFWELPKTDLRKITTTEEEKKLFSKRCGFHEFLKNKTHNLF